MMYFVTSNPFKAQQLEKYGVKVVYSREEEEKWPLPEIVVAKKVTKTNLRPLIADDRALYLTEEWPAGFVKCFEQMPQQFEGKGEFVFSLAFKDREELSVFSRTFPVHIKKKGKEKLEDSIIILPFTKPYSALTKREKEKIEKKLHHALFKPFFNALIGKGKKITQKASHITRIVKFFRSLKHGPLEKIWEYLSSKDYHMSIKRRVLLSAAFYPLETFFPNYKVIGNFGSFPKPDTIKNTQLLDELLEFHASRFQVVEEISEIEEEEKEKPRGKIMAKGQKVFIRRNGLIEELRFGEVDEKFAAEVFRKMHYLSSSRKAKRVYGLYDRKNRVVALMAISPVEREYKKKFLERSGIEARELSRAYSALNAEGVLSFLASKIQKKHGVMLTSYQPSFAEGVSIFAAGFSPFIIKPQQNFYRLEGKHKYPVFVIRRELKGNEVQGKMPLLPTLDLIKPASAWIHFYRWQEIL